MIVVILLVCKAWRKMALDPKWWKRCDLHHADEYYFEHLRSLISPSYRAFLLASYPNKSITETRYQFFTEKAIHAFVKRYANHLETITRTNAAAPFTLGWYRMFYIPPLLLLSFFFPDTYKLTFTKKK
jgi:hypothetical protein